jgi:hypothetical protein
MSKPTNQPTTNADTLQELLQTQAQWKAWADGQREVIARTTLLGPNPERVLAVSGGGADTWQPALTRPTGYPSCPVVERSVLCF